MKRIWPILLLTLLLTGCGESQQAATNESQPTGETRSEAKTTAKPETTANARSAPETTRESTPVPPDQEPAPPTYGYTYGQASGNRIVEGAGGLPESNPVDVQLDGVPTWVVGVPLQEDTAWIVTLEDGRVQAFRLNGLGEAKQVPITPDRLAPGQPPLVKVQGNSLELVTAQNPQASEFTHPVPVSPGQNEGLLGVEQDWGAFLERGGAVEDLGFAALPDARFARGAGGTLAALSAPTELYEHAVLGDGVEADSLTLLRPGEDGGLEAGFVAPASGGVFELVAPLWFEGPGIDGELLALTESTVDQATRVSVYGLDGSLVAAGPYIGEPFRWRHLIAAGPFGPNGEIELVDTLTPHLGGVVEFYELDAANKSLNIVATMPGYTSHRIYTRNLDTARAGDLDGDGRWELLVPNDAYTELGAIRHEADGAVVAWSLPADGIVVTNLDSATNSEGRAQIAAGRGDGVLRIWP